jgi:UDP-N-acetylmuramoyl-L-alanyl-D-glutamate--2,6-diaminopimelate ligase
MFSPVAEWFNPPAISNAMFLELPATRASVAGLYLPPFAGFRTDGNRFALQAIAAGAAAVVSVSPSLADLPVDAKVAWIQVEDDRDALAILASNFYDQPTAKLHAIGITGTNGKTTTTYLVESILKAAGHPTAVFGTVEYRGPGFEYQAERTTPEARSWNRCSGKVVDGGWKHAVMEVSSHAIDLKRVEGLHFDVAVLQISAGTTRLPQDMRSYFLAKSGCSPGWMERFRASWC